VNQRGKGGAKLTAGVRAEQADVGRNAQSVHLAEHVGGAEYRVRLLTLGGEPLTMSDNAAKLIIITARPDEKNEVTKVSLNVRNGETVVDRSALPAGTRTGELIYSVNGKKFVTDLDGGLLNAKTTAR